MKLIFTDADDVHGPVGKLAFGACGLEFIAEARGLPSMRVRCAVGQPDGSYWVYGLTGGGERPWRILRARTFDGIAYEGGEVVYEHPVENWLGEGDIAYNRSRGEMVCWKWRRSEDGHALWAFGSGDGRDWQPLTDEAVYRDHDAFGIMWDESAGRYLCCQATYQPCEKRYSDNIGDARRRVLHIRTSPDGVHWTPDRDVPWDGPYMPDDVLITPDAGDPPDVEFDRLTPLAYAGRYVGMMLMYAPSPQIANPRFPKSLHGPQCYGQWWISRDGRNWRRPYRDVFAPGEADGVIEHEPMTIGGRHLWARDGKVYGLGEDRIFFVGAQANAELSTVPFEMPDGPLAVNAALCYHDSPTRGMRGQGYLMAELTAADGAVVAGFERDRCVRHHIDGPAATLRWGDQDGSKLAGQTVRLRLCFRDARIYAVTAQ